MSPRAGRSSGLTQRPVTLGPNATRQIEVAIRSKLGKEGNPKPDDIIAEQMKIDVKLSPTDPDSPLEARDFPSVQRDVALSNEAAHKDEVSLTAYGQRSGMAGDIDRFAEYPLRIEGLEFLPSLGYSSVSPVSWPTQGQRVPTTGPAYTETVELVSCPTEKQMGQTYTETFEQRGLPQVRTKKGYIPLRLSTEVTIHLADELSEIR